LIIHLKTIDINNKIYNKEMNKELYGEIESLDKRDIKRTVNTMYDVITNHMRKLLFDENYAELAEILVDESNRSDLQSMKSNLKAWHTSVHKLTEDFLEDVAETKNRSMSLASTLFRLEEIMNKMQEHISDIKDESDTSENMQKAYYYRGLLVWLLISL
jgi:hypothetical protein